MGFLELVEFLFILNTANVLSLACVSLMGSIEHQSSCCLHSKEF